jgi:hypothetical protein
MYPQIKLARSSLHGQTQKGATKPALIYPETLESGTSDGASFMVFSIKDYSDGIEKPKGVQDIVMYIPTGALKTSYGADWTSRSFGVAGQIGAELVGGMNDNSSGLVDQIKKGMASMSEFDVQQFTMMMVAKNAVLPGLTSDIQQSIASHVTRKVADPYMHVFFKGVGFRQHAFEFKMIPKSEDESRLIRNIIKEFKSNMLPSVPRTNLNRAETRDAAPSPTGYLNFPNEFDISFFPNGAIQNRHNQTLFKLSRSVLTNMSVDYNGSGIPVFFKRTGEPVQISMTLNFKETSIMTRQTAEAGY